VVSLPAVTVALPGVTLTETAGGVLIVTLALALFAVSACEVAVTVTVPPVGTEMGAVKATGLSVLLAKPPHNPAGTQLHVTAVFAAPVTTAVNCAVAPASIAAGGLVRVTAIGGGVTVTVEVAVLLVLACEVAVTMTLELGTVAGAV
jgi:hypothetical protein